nr:small subunit processome component 20 homolog [Ipomoea batatas]
MFLSTYWLFNVSLILNRYEHSTGREAVLEMLRAIIVKIPDRIQEQSQSIFMHLVICLANDQDNKVRSMAGVSIKLLAENMKKFGSLTSIIEYSFSWYRGEKQHLWSSAAQVLGLLVEVMGNSFQEYVSDVLSVTKKILQSACAALANRQLGLSDEVVPLWKEVYYSLVLLEKIHHQFTALCFTKELQDLWETICDFLLYPHMWVRSISVRLIDLYFARVTKACNENQALLWSFFLMEPSRLFQIAVSLICQLNVQLVKDADEALITQNLVFAICGIQALLVHGSGHSAFGPEEQSRFLKAFNLLDPKKGRSIFTAFSSYYSAQGNEQQTEHQGSMIVSCLLKRMGKIPIQMEALQTRIVFNCFKSMSIKLLDQSSALSSEDEVDCQSYAYQILLPLYKVCEGQAGKVISVEASTLTITSVNLGSVRPKLTTFGAVKIESLVQYNVLLISSEPKKPLIQNLLKEFSDSESIAEFQLKLGEFELNGKSTPPPPITAPITVTVSTAAEAPNSYTSISTTSLALGKPLVTPAEKDALLATAAEEAWWGDVRCLLRFNLNLDFDAGISGEVVSILLEDGDVTILIEV